MKDQSLIEVLEDAGLSPYQAEAYVTLLELGNATATNLVDACDVPDPRIYDVLRDLESKGYVETYEQDSLTARANDPETVLGDLRAKSEEYLTAAEEIDDRWSQPAVSQHDATIVKRQETVINHAKSVIEEAETQVQLASSLDQFRAIRSELATAYRKGVTVKVSVYDDEGPPATDEFEGACTEVRWRELAMPFVAIVDRDRTCFVPNSDSGAEYGVLVEESNCAYVFYWFFISSCWDVWETLYSDRPDGRKEEYVDVRECIRDFYRLLEDDATIEVVVDGYETDTEEHRELEGRVVDVRFTGDPGAVNGSLPPTHLAGRASIVLDVDGDRIEVGGWGATVEDIEATTVRVTDVEY